MTFEQAAAVPTAGVVALQHLRCKRPIQPGQKVLINGAGGSVGTFAVQLAKHFGAEVTGVDSAGKLDMMRSIGADHVIDYRQEDFTKSGQRYDLILDVVAHRSVFAYRRALHPEGICLLVGGSIAVVFQALLLGPLISRTERQQIGLGMWEPNNKEDLAELAELFEAGKIAPIIDRRYPLHEVAEAFRYLASGHHQGKIVITV
jgi:NADPH:quinone reductase-like Zn-dependent oxidoreductase